MTFITNTGVVVDRFECLHNRYLYILFCHTLVCKIIHSSSVHIA